MLLRALPAVFLAFGVVIACGTHLTATSDAKLVNTERFAAFQLQDCAGDAGKCSAAQVRQLATQIGCAVASVRADGKTGPADAGAACAQAGAAP